MNVPDRPVFLLRRKGVDYYIDYQGRTWMKTHLGLVEYRAGVNSRVVRRGLQEHKGKGKEKANVPEPPVDFSE